MDGSSIDILKTGLADGSVIQTDTARKFTIGGITDTYKIYKVRLDKLYYNDKNDRIATWLSQYRSENNGNVPDTKDIKKYNDLIEQFIIASNPQAINKTKENIRQVDQREAAIVLYDGRIVDGNRRFTCMRLLSQENEKYNYLECIILDKSIACNEKQIKMLELSIQHGEEGKIDYNPVDLLVGLYHDIEETKLLSINEYARSANCKPNIIKKKIETAKLMVEYLDFINAPKQFHVIRDLQLLFPLEELSRMLKKCQSGNAAEDLKICVFTNILMRTSSDLGRFVRKIKDIMSTSFFEEYINEQLKIAEEVLDTFPKSGINTSKTLRETIKNNTELTYKLERSMDKALTKAHNSETQNRLISILEDINILFSSISSEMCARCSSSDIFIIKEQLDKINTYILNIKSYIEKQDV